MAKQQQSAPRSRRFYLFLFLAIFPLIAAAVFAGFAGLVYTGQFGPVPEPEELADIRHHQASTVNTADGETLGRYYLQNRDKVSLDEVSDDFLDALLAIEDIRFYEHNGLDYRAMGRVFVRTLLLQQDAGGGSTLTQQLAKNLYPRQGYNWFSIAADKVREIIIALRMEQIYSKEEILRLYINTVSFGEDTWGIKTASQRFFNTNPEDLELHQAATLAGVLRATTYYNPRRNPENALARRNLVLVQMERYGLAEAERTEQARSRPLDLDYNRLSHGEGMAPHFRRHLQSRLQHILTTRPALDGNTYNLYTDGLTVETSIHSGLQKAAQEAVNTNLKQLQAAFDEHREHEFVFREEDPIVLRAWQNSERYQNMQRSGAEQEELDRALDDPVTMDWFTWDGMKTVEASPRDSIRHYLSFLNAGFLAMHPSSGEIKAWVGGISHKHFQYDHVRARRQPGSAFKPVVYAAALEAGAEPCDYRRNLRSRYVSYDDWTPSNLQEAYGGHYSIQGALAQSVNTISVDLLRETGIPEIRETARRMGIDSPLHEGPSLALGTAEVSLLELTRAYTSFANRGTPATPRYLKAIYNAEGELIYDFTTATLQNPSSSTEETFVTANQSAPQPAFSAETASAMIKMLSQTVESGTASALQTRYGLDFALAGKTGTAQNNTDGWFIGITPDLVFGSWTGGVTQQVQLPEAIGYASRTALPMAGTFLQQADRNAYVYLPEQFYHYQRNHPYQTNCEDYREEGFTDNVKDFFTGRDSDEAQIVDDEEEDQSIIDRVRGWFSND